MNRIERATVIGWIVLCTLAVLYALVVAVATSQAPPTDDPVVLLARTCVSERSWALETHDCRAIGEVVLSTVRRSYAHLRVLSPRLHGETPIARPWLRELDEGARRPASWPGGRWTDYRREHWLATLDEARAIYEGRLAPVCDRPPVSWGSEADILARSRLRRARWVGVDWGRTVNRFGGWVR